MSEQSNDPGPTTDVIASLLVGMSERIREETRQSPLYAELAAQRTLTGRVRLAHSKMTEVVLTLTDVLRDVDGIEITAERYALLQGLVLSKAEFEEHFRTSEGNAGCVDKAFGAISRTLTEEAPEAP